MSKEDQLIFSIALKICKYLNIDSGMAFDNSYAENYKLFLPLKFKILKFFNEENLLSEEEKEFFKGYKKQIMLNMEVEDAVDNIYLEKNSNKQVNPYLN